MGTHDDSNPYLVPPPKEPDDVMSQRKSSRSQNSALKNKARLARVAAKTVSFKKNPGKLGKKGSKSVDGMDGVEFGEGSGVAEDEFDGDVASSVDAYSVDSRSCGDSVSEREFHDDIGEGMVNSNPNVTASSFVSNAKGHVNQSAACESSDYNMGNIDCEKLGNVSKNASNNSSQNASVNPGSSPRILKRGEVLSDGGSKVDAAFSFNKVEKWPSLGSDTKETSNLGNNGNMDV
ncbi:hypothetical protein CTI12_AA291050 [Artemisia annua]|uniref:Uncharacterized protein n=1 Tax=Artemisia annua TaxID=35608 RepID=A0A2U1N9T2_ARTAN|nr:hypothetical protein CTI12_AA291050 [Artemisia annua]